MNETIDRQTVGFVEVTSLVPKDWTTWFYAVISEDAPFSWGDNNRTLVTAERFYNHCANRLEDIDEITQEEIESFLETIKELGQTYIDLEN